MQYTISLIFFPCYISTLKNSPPFFFCQTGMNPLRREIYTYKANRDFVFIFLGWTMTHVQFAAAIIKRSIGIYKMEHSLTTLFPSVSNNLDTKISVRTVLDCKQASSNFIPYKQTIKIELNAYYYYYYYLEWQLHTVLIAYNFLIYTTLLEFSPFNFILSSLRK